MRFAYGVAEIASGYGFLAVFVSAATLRSAERQDDYHRVFTDSSKDSSVSSWWYSSFCSVDPLGEGYSPDPASNRWTTCPMRSGHESFEDAELLWATVTAAIICSLVIQGTTATAALRTTE